MEKIIDFGRISGNLDQHNIHLEEKKLEQLDLYAKLLVEWNEKINLTAITIPQEIENKHFIDSLLLSCHPEVKGKLVDVGTGAGFPGMIVKIDKPEVEVTLMEPTGKRVRFLQEVAIALDVSVDIVKERAEEAARKQWRESFDVATARAVAALPTLCEYCLPLVRVGGFFIAMKGSDAALEVKAAENAMQKLGGKLDKIQEFSLPDGSLRSLVFIKKVENTPKIYPRNGGTIAKKPLL